MKPWKRSTLPFFLVSILIAACGKGGGDAPASSGKPAGTTAPAGTPAKSGAKPAPPKDAATSCTVKFKGTAPGKGGPEYTITNTGTRPLRYCQIEAYAYDKSNKQVAKKSLSYNATIQPGASRDEKFFPLEETATKTPGLTFEAVVTAVIFTDDAEWRDYNLAPSERPKGGKK